MFNHKLYGRAICDPELEKNELRVLYLILNNMSLNNTDRIEMFNGFVMDKLHISERTVQRTMDSLERKGYIGREIKGTSVNRKGNIIYIPDSADDNADVTGDTPYNVHDKKHHVEKVQVSEVEGTDNFQDTHDNPMMKKKEKNRHITGLFNELGELNQRYFGSTSLQECNGIINRFNDVWDEATQKYQEGYFTDEQVSSLQKFYDNFIKIRGWKEKYFSREQKECR